LENQNTVTIPDTALPAGSYWLELHNGPLTQTTDSSFYWETTSFGTLPHGESQAAPFTGPFMIASSDHAFQVQSVPEPAVVMQVCTGLGMLGTAMRRRRRRGDAGPPGLRGHEHRRALERRASTTNGSSSVPKAAISV
jgi:hypothetical protein